MENTSEKKPHIRIPVLVEGRYDKSAVLSIFSGTVITTEGFGVFNSKEKQLLIRRIAKDGLILLTDSDAGGKQIRSFITGILPKDKIYQLYIPRIEGKERRKAHAGKEGVLGVEGVGGDILRSLLTPFTDEVSTEAVGTLTPTHLFELGLMGGNDSKLLRDKLCQRLSLPCGMNSKALLAALNIVSSGDEVRRIMKDITL